MHKFVIAAAAAAAFVSTAALASASYDPVTQTGFVGKGDVQVIEGWNNKQLQDNAASVGFSWVSSTVTEVSWECTNSNNQTLQERARTSTTTVSGVVTTIARDGKKQITGFNLGALTGGSSISTTDGPPVNSCPSGPWSLTSPAGDPSLVSSEGGLTYKGNPI